MMGDDCRASVIIATIGRPDLVCDCAQSMKLVGVPDDVELLVVDAGGENGVDPGELQAIWARSRVFPSRVKNAGIQRNLGAKLAASETLIYLDDDTLLQPGWWPAIVKPLEEPSVGVAAGAVWRNPSPMFTDRRGGYVNAFGVPVQVTHRSEKAAREVDWPISCNMACRREAYHAVGGMAEVFGIYDEDVDFGLKLRRAGWRIVFVPGAAVYHYAAVQYHKPPSKQTAYRAGRNRAILLWRNYGLSFRLLAFLVAAPFDRLGRLVLGVVRFTYRAAGHAFAYLFGIPAGIRAAVRHPIGEDLDDYTKQDEWLDPA